MGAVGWNPGKTALRSFWPRCPRTSSPSTARKSVVTARSRPSKELLLFETRPLAVDLASLHGAA